MDRQHILDEIRRTARQNGGTPLGKQRFFNETGIRESDWRGRYWVRWSDAVQEAGNKPNTKQAALEDAFLLGKFAEFVRELGRYPVAAELRMKARQQPGFPSHNTFSRFGRSNAPGRREYESAIQLPEPAVTLHVIKTDDPVGIEKYWHQRFASCRKNGEWFELSRENVSAFRRRKFM